MFLTPKSRDDKKTFAQCGSCRMFVPEVQDLEGSRCVIHGSKVDVDKDDSCGFWVDWPTPAAEPNPAVVEDHAHELAQGIRGSVTPAESGLVDEKVQCHRCVFFNSAGPTCGLFEELNEALPHFFDLDTKITRNSCCNAWTSK